MSNYYLNSTTVKLSDVAKYITNTSVANAYVGNGLTSYTSVFTANVNEIPNDFNYKYNGTDISTYCIAAYVESGGTNTFSSIPAWCKNIRAILIGGGGGGFQQYNNYDAHRNQNNNHGNEHDNNNIGQHQHVSGAGGGGGGFIYLKTTPVTSVSIQVGSGGAPANPGSNTILTTSAGTFTAYGGGNGVAGVNGAAGDGGAGGITTQVTNGAYNNGTAGTKSDSQTLGVAYNATGLTCNGGVGGNAGTQNTYTTNTNMLNYGKGGDGVSITYSIHSNQNQWFTQSAPTSTQAATSGSAGYYRIYFLQ